MLLHDNKITFIKFPNFDRSIVYYIKNLKAIMDIEPSLITKIEMRNKTVFFNALRLKALSRQRFSFVSCLMMSCHSNAHLENRADSNLRILF